MINEYRCTPRIGQPMTIFNPTEAGARHICMTTTYGDASITFPNNGIGLDVELIGENVTPPKQGVYVYVDPKSKKAE